MKKINFKTLTENSVWKKITSTNDNITTKQELDALKEILDSLRQAYKENSGDVLINFYNNKFPSEKLLINAPQSQLNLGSLIEKFITKAIIYQENQTIKENFEKITQKVEGTNELNNEEKNTQTVEQLDALLKNSNQKVTGLLGVSTAFEIKRQVNRNLRQVQPSFRKSYSTLSSYTPFISCSINYSFFTDNEVTKEASQRETRTNKVGIFDIPYNYIKGLKFESKSGDPKSTVLTINIEEPNGTLLSGLFAFMYLRGSDLDISKSGTPTLTVSFGWGGSERNVVKKQKKQGLEVSKKTLSQTYLISKANVSYEGTKQKLELVCSVDFQTAWEQQSNTKPYDIFGDSVTSFLIRNRLHYFSNQNIQKFNQSFPGINNHLPISNSNNRIKTAEVTVLPTSKNSFLKNYALTDNTYFTNYAVKSDINDSALGEKLNRWVHPYIVFCCVLNRYSAYKNFDNFKQYVFLAFSEKDIVEFTKNREFPDTLINKTPGNTEDAYLKDLFNYASEIRASDPTQPYLNKSSSVIKPTDNWDSVLKNFAEKVKIKKNDQLYELSASVLQVSKDEIEDGIKKVRFFLEKVLNFTTVRQLEKAIDKKLGAQFIFLAPKGYNFTPNNVPIQQYTVLPKVKGESRPNKSYFNSGSKRLIDESFPDVLLFQPKLDLANAIYTAINEKKFVPSAGGKLGTKFNFVNQNESSEEVLTKTFKKLANIFEKQNEELILHNINDGQAEFEDVKVFFATLKGHTTQILHFKVVGKKVIKIASYTTLDNKRQRVSTSISFDDLKTDFDSEAVFQNKSTLSVTVDSIFSKSNRISLNEPNSQQYASFFSKTKTFFSQLKKATFGFKAELKILGEPAFSDISLITDVYYIMLNVNNPDGTENELLTGGYLVEGVVQEIDGGKFTTTLSLSYDAPNLSTYF